MKRALFLLAACTAHHPTGPHPPAVAGISISLYSLGTPESSYGVVDDRRWVELAGNQLVLEHIEPGASLASLVIEPLSGGTLAIERCVREALPEPPPKPAAPIVAQPPPAVVVPVPVSDQQSLAREIMLRRLRAEQIKKQIAKPEPEAMARVDATVVCTVGGTPGRHLVRILYVSTKLDYRVQHALTVTTPDRAKLVTRFAIATPAWHEHADVIVYDGVPGGQRPPTEVTRGAVALDGSIAILSTPARETAARVRRIYDGAVVTPQVDVADAAWNSESSHGVWVWLELPHTTLAPGPVSAHVELPDELPHDVELAAGVRGTSEDDDDTLRLPLWVDTQLIGTRLRFTDPSAGPSESDSGLAERLLLSVANQSDAPREVWVEEHVRRSRHRKLLRAWPKRPTATGDVVREKLVVKPHAIERVGYTVEYVF
ncbi:MAG: hypothetical protein ABI591_18500 [Kofleriaceae bacterium]